jgi:DNA-binding GntR family transcriptional regulator
LAIGRQVKPTDLGDGRPVIRMIEGKMGSRVVRAEQVLEADYAGEVAARYLDLLPSTPVLKVTRIYFDVSGRPMEAVFVRNHPERYRYSVEFNARPKVV